MRASYSWNISVFWVELVPSISGKVEETEIVGEFDYNGVWYNKVKAPPLPSGILET